MSSCNDVFWLAISRASSAASSTATSTAAKIRELDDIPMVLSSAFHFVLNALGKAETHLYLAVDVARGNLHVSGIHSLYIQRGQPPYISVRPMFPSGKTVSPEKSTFAFSS
jgi:hypothetical protein